MTEIEKVIKGVWQCWLPSDEEEYETQCHDCPYYERGITLKECMTALRKDTIELLKEQPQIVPCYDCVWFDHYTAECEKGHDPTPPYTSFSCTDGKRKEGR